MRGKSKTTTLTAPRAWSAVSGSLPVLFLLFVFLFGGGSRSDIASLPLLRGGAILFACWAATGLDAQDWKRIRIPMILLLLLAFWIGIQLIPLPPSIWHTMPERQTIVAIDALLGQPGLWRPISLTPSQTLNSLLAMSVPIAALMVAARMRGEDYVEVMFAIVVIATFSALLGLIQVLSGVGNAAYFYRITDPVSMVGLFANRNHHSIFLALALLVAATLLRDELLRKRQRRMAQAGLVFAALILTMATALIGSRAGFAAGIVAFCLGYAVVGKAWRQVDRAPDSRRRPQRLSPLTERWKMILLYLPPVLLIGVLGVILGLGGRSSVVTRFMGEGVADDLRVRAWPTVQAMIENFWVAGSGLGSFPDVYKMFEPDALLQPSYFNHAHNDWTESVITGGLPFMLIVFVALLWIGRAILAKGLRNLIKGFRGDIRLMIMAVVALLIAASATDYPLRVPSIQAVSIILIIMLVSPSVAASGGDDRGGRRVDRRLRA